MLGPKQQDFWPRMNILEGKKMVMFLENKVVQKLKLENNVFK